MTHHMTIGIASQRIILRYLADELGERLTPFVILKEVKA